MMTMMMTMMNKQSHVIILTIFLILVLHTCHYIIIITKLDSDDHYIEGKKKKEIGNCFFLEKYLSH